MNKFFAPQFLFALLFPLLSWGQSQDTPPKPTPPFISPMPDNTTWTIKLTRKAATVPPPPGTRLVDQIVNTKSGANRELLTQWSDGSRSYLWFYHGYRLEQNRGSEPIRVTLLRGGMDPQNTDFNDFQWLDLSNYIGLETVNSQACFHFKATIKPQYQRINLDYSADIDIKSKTPVAWDVGANHFDLTSTTSANLSELPPSFAAALKAYQVAMASAHSYKP